ncbi:nitrate- and nitrite sensing domain-containing protein, partial [Salmonella enterica]|uniref:nitrate- and nitrite sensing domain-containing protein n=1 Tax=Salmonella enterica TaxID=28901 RepID=UPI001C601903
SNIFSMDRFDDGQFSMFSDVVGQHDAWLTAARSFSTPVQAAELDKSLQSAEATRALELRETAFNKAAEGGFGVNPTDWFNLQTQRIETLQKVENRAVDALQEHAALLAHNARVDWQS